MSSLVAKAAKPRPSRLPWRSIQAMAELTEKGARKRGEHLPDEIPDAEAVYREALLRHVIAWASGEVLDEEGTPHVRAIAFNAAWLDEIALKGGGDE